MIKNQIITKLAESKVLERYVASFSSDRELMGDLCQEVFLVLLEYDPETILTAYEKGEIQYLAFRIAKNMYFSIHSPFYYKYLKYEANKTGNRIHSEEF